MNVAGGRGEDTAALAAMLPAEAAEAAAAAATAAAAAAAAAAAVDGAHWAPDPERCLADAAEDATPGLQSCKAATAAEAAGVVAD